MNVTRLFHAGTNVMHAAKVKGERDTEDFMVSYTSFARIGFNAPTKEILLLQTACTMSDGLAGEAKR